ncbi:MAG: hypothetical protein QG654_553 [Patescibacteria group bacterium]|nr:hypothetical protein [Patescibacteria group bacterium]
MQPKKEDFSKEYSSFLNCDDFNESLIIKKLKEDEELKDKTVFNLKEKLYEQENPEFLNKDYLTLIEKVISLSYSLRDVSEVARDLVDEFLEENNIYDPVIIRGFPYEDLNYFAQKNLIFFDKRLSPTLLGLAQDDFPYLKENLPMVRENILKTIDGLGSGGFELLPKDEEKIKILEERLALVENL